LPAAEQTITPIDASVASSSPMPYRLSGKGWFTESLSDMFTDTILYVAALATTHCSADSM
jgi:hypothetical protein